VRSEQPDLPPAAAPQQQLQQAAPGAPSRAASLPQALSSSAQPSPRAGFLPRPTQLATQPSSASDAGAPASCPASARDAGAACLGSRTALLLAPAARDASQQTTPRRDAPNDAAWAASAAVGAQAAGLEAAVQAAGLEVAALKASLSDASARLDAALAAARTALRVLASAEGGGDSLEQQLVEARLGALGLEEAMAEVARLSQALVDDWHSQAGAAAAAREQLTQAQVQARVRDEVAQASARARAQAASGSSRPGSGARRRQAEQDVAALAAERDTLAGEFDRLMSQLEVLTSDKEALVARGEQLLAERTALVQQVRPGKSGQSGCTALRLARVPAVCLHAPGAAVALLSRAGRLALVSGSITSKTSTLPVPPPHLKGRSRRGGAG
jgi:hypothetical protein